MAVVFLVILCIVLNVVAFYFNCAQQLGYIFSAFCSVAIYEGFKKVRKKLDQYPKTIGIKLIRGLHALSGERSGYSGLLVFGINVYQRVI